MSKVGNALKMLILLKSRGKMKISELARELEVDERQISRYKDDLEQAGIYITSTPGRYGGYTVEGKDYLVGLNLTKGEHTALLMAENHLKHEEFHFYEDFKMIVEKINIAKENEFNRDLSTDYFIKGSKSSFDYEIEKKIWLDISRAIITSKKVQIVYDSLKNATSKRIVRPYDFFQYKGSLYLVGFCEKRKEIRQFKISRIIEYKILEETFEKGSSFNVKDYMKESFGIFKDGSVDLILKIDYPYAKIVKEKFWIEGQKIEDYKEENYLIFKAKMEGKTEIKSWILNMGSYVEVIEPEDFREEVKKELREIIKKYEN